MKVAADAGLLAVTGAGLAVVCIITGVGQWRQGIAAALELWVAAGLLRLGFDPTADRILAAGAIIAIRQILTHGFISPSGERQRDSDSEHEAGQ